MTALFQLQVSQSEDASVPCSRGVGEPKIHTDEISFNALASPRLGQQQRAWGCCFLLLLLALQTKHRPTWQLPSPASTERKQTGTAVSDFRKAIDAIIIQVSGAKQHHPPRPQAYNMPWDSRDSHTTLTSPDLRPKTSRKASCGPGGGPVRPYEAFSPSLEPAAFLAGIARRSRP